MRQAIDNYTMDKQQPQSSKACRMRITYRGTNPVPVSQQKDWVLHFGDTVLTRSRMAQAWTMCVPDPRPPDQWGSLQHVVGPACAASELLASRASQSVVKI